MQGEEKTFWRSSAVKKLHSMMKDSHFTIKRFFVIIKIPFVRKNA
jgi:hypothetical protein